MYTIYFNEILEDLPSLMMDIQADLEETMNEEFARDCENQIILAFQDAA